MNEEKQEAEKKLKMFYRLWWETLKLSKPYCEYCEWRRDWAMKHPDSSYPPTEDDHPDQFMEAFEIIPFKPVKEENIPDVFGPLKMITMVYDTLFGDVFTGEFEDWWKKEGWRSSTLAETPIVEWEDMLTAQRSWRRDFKNKGGCIPLPDKHCETWACSRVMDDGTVTVKIDITRNQKEINNEINVLLKRIKKQVAAEEGFKTEKDLLLEIKSHRMGKDSLNKVDLNKLEEKLNIYKYYREAMEEIGPYLTKRTTQRPKLWDVVKEKGHIKEDANDSNIRKWGGYVNDVEEMIKNAEDMRFP